MTRAGAALVLVLAALLLAPAFDASAQSRTGPGRSAAAECAERLRAASEDGSSEGAPRLADVCADLAEQLDYGEWAPALGSIGAGELTARPFRELVDLMGHYERRPHATGLAIDELEAVVDALRPFEPVAELSLWDRIREWLRKRLGLDERDDGGGLLAWLRNLSIPDAWIRTIVYVLGITVVIGALVVAVNELRLSGVLGGRGSRRDGRKDGEVPPWAKRVPLTYDAVKRAPPVRQPALLLGLLVERLRGRFGDAVRDSLTHRELAAAAETLGVRRRDELEAVASAAERVTFSGWRPEPSDAERVLAQGKAVLDELEAAPPPAAAGSS